MGRYVSWVHGNAFTGQSPENLEAGEQHLGWGADIFVKPGKGSWFHVPLPVPAVVDEYPVYVTQTFFLFRTETNASLRHVHIYDGAQRLKAFDDLHFDGDFTGLIVPTNTFVLNAPYAVQRGISLSFFIQGSLGPAPGNRLVVPAIGAEYYIGRPILATVARRFDQLIRRQS